MSTIPTKFNPLGIYKNKTEKLWSPKELGDALAVWFDASDNSTVLNASGQPCGDGDKVYTWIDKTVNSYILKNSSGQDSFFL